MRGNRISLQLAELARGIEYASRFDLEIIDKSNALHVGRVLPPAPLVAPLAGESGRKPVYAGGFFFEHVLLPVL
jgi:hypothetical protein